MSTFANQKLPKRMKMIRRLPRPGVVASETMLLRNRRAGVHVTKMTRNPEVDVRVTRRRMPKKLRSRRS
jgi:hypothetical protein